MRPYHVPVGARCGCSAKERRERPVVGDPWDVYEILRPIAEREVQEVIWVLPIDIQGHLVKRPIEVARGQQARVAVDMRNLLRPPILEGTRHFVFCHNHPSGSLDVSDSDRDLTEAAEDAAECAGLFLFDHVVVAPPSGFYSFRLGRSYRV